MTAVILATSPATSPKEESIDGRVVQVRMPAEDITLYYNEMRGGMAVELRGLTASVSGTKFYLGDGEVAVSSRVVNLRGIVFQGTTELNQGFRFKKGSEVKVLPGYKRATDLAPGDVYVTLPGVEFIVPAR